MHLLKLSGKGQSENMGKPYFKQDQGTCLTCALSFLFSVERSMKKGSRKWIMYCSFFQQLDNLVWGTPLIGALGRNRDLPDPSLGFASDTLPSKAFRLIFTEDEGHGDISSFRSPCDSSSGYCRDGEYCRGGYSDSDRWPRCPSFGCGWLPSLEWRPSMQKDS